ncbi:MAG: aminoacyl-tRNA hydrolase [Patescibacteria group bacterium]
MKVVIGLGNPGEEYTNTRHNVGRETVETIAKYFKCDPLTPDKKYAGLVTKGVLGEEKALYILPDTFMNRSGKALSEISAKPKDLIVIHDDTDLPLGTIKISFGKNSAGHKGVESIMRAIKSKDFWRVRIGIQKKKRVDAMKLVLQKFTPAERSVIKKVEKRVIDVLEQPLTVTTISI